MKPRNNTKAWLRRGKAHRLQDKFYGAKNDPKKAVSSMGLDSWYIDYVRRETNSSNKLASSMVRGGG
jgi:hypothetical protein